MTREGAIADDNRKPSASAVFSMPGGDMLAITTTLLLIDSMAPGWQGGEFEMRGRRCVER